MEEENEEKKLAKAVPKVLTHGQQIRRQELLAQNDSFAALFHVAKVAVIAAVTLTLNVTQVFLSLEP
ncbi:hypothetical protein VC83_06670 [Pseudogymnoascus destructans]|uniref:Uncharacterized protein n=1 Tax=Pseudogymnoascus destructans TaxID=655981 RepID=A0A177A211_9PEZI|nr:uncharacterized protein VC83_06670 [Pseudogymnoascus destructans]OAF56319.1 hypothetical protein VC83_06670 [Pseudogymnoascus destructans]